MNDQLEEIFRKSLVTDEAGKELPLHSHTSREQCLFLDEMITLSKPHISLEIGLAYGISTLQILKSVSKIDQNFTHIVMDPFQHEWNNVGLLNIDRSGYKDHVKFYAEQSTIVLPRLHAEKTRIQFAYIDSTKVFDQLLVDVHYITRMMDNRGILVLDDCDFPGIRLLARFLARHQSFEVYKGFSPDPVTLKSRIADNVVNLWLSLMPFRKRKLSRLDIDNDAALGVNYKCVAFRKIMDDTRPWNWHHAF
jgi:predicted O-methyltransferase YrrM